MAAVMVQSAICEGYEAQLVTLEASVARGFSGIQLLGNPSELCRDGKERARHALEALGMTLPNHRIILSFYPAAPKKDSAHFDLAMAVSLYLLTVDETAVRPADGWLFLGELGLHGEIRPIANFVTYALGAAMQGLRGLVVSRAHIADWTLLKKLCGDLLGPLELIGCDQLQEVLGWLQGQAPENSDAAPASAAPQRLHSLASFDDMELTPEVQTLVACVAAGRHNLLLRGAPGCGKSMLAHRLPSLMPTLDQSAHLRVLQIYNSVMDTIPDSIYAGRPPFRAPHHSASAASILGNGRHPGELTLSHAGVLFLDEFPEFRRDVLEALREPLESGTISVSRAAHRSTWDADVLLVAAYNPCPCGWFGSSHRRCMCRTQQILAYQQRLSGPVLERLDIHFTMPEIRTAAGNHAVGCQQTLLKRVDVAIDFAYQRNRRWGFRWNRDLPPQYLGEATGLTDQHLQEFWNSRPDFLSLRQRHKILRVARTLADLEEKITVTEEHLIQAVNWQSMPQGMETQTTSQRFMPHLAYKGSDHSNRQIIHS